MSKQFLTLPGFPNSQAEPLEITSPATGDYNCIAWALEQTDCNYWAHPDGFFNWLPGIPCEETPKAFILLFQSAGYEICETGNPEPGFQKVALFTKDGLPTHVARQLPDGAWTSKVGILEDVRHSLQAISGGMYGEVTVFLKRQETDQHVGVNDVITHQVDG